MTTFILLMLLGAMCSFAFHASFGQSARSIPGYLMSGLGGALVGFALDRILGWNWLMVGGLPIFMTTCGSLVFLVLVQRIRFD